MKYILWVDDNESLIDNSAPLFERNGFHVFKAINTSRALAILREEKVDGVLLDVRLSGGEDGLELLGELRHLYPKLQIAIFTGYPEHDDHVIAEEIGAATYLAKIEKSIPLDPEKQRRFFKALDKVFPGQRNRPTKIIVAITLLIIGVVTSLVVNVATSSLPTTVQNNVWISWPILILLVVISALLILKQ